MRRVVISLVVFWGVVICSYGSSVTNNSLAISEDSNSPSSTFRNVSHSIPNDNNSLSMIIEPRPEYVPDVVIFKLRNPEEKRSGPPVNIQELVQHRMQKITIKHNLRQTKRLFAKHKSKQFKHIYRGHLPHSKSPVEAAEKLKADPDIEWAEPDYLAYPDETIPNDPSYSIQEHLPTIFAPTAWDITTGDPNVVIAVIDLGVDYNHPDLAANIWQNPGEIEGDGIDNDENGYIDDIIGWDFYQSDNTPNEVDNHGTHVAGISAAVGNNVIGVAGITWRCKIMCLRAGSSSFKKSNIAEALVYAGDNSADVVNMSFAGGPSILEKTAIDYANSRGCIMAASAGNSAWDNLSYPNSYHNVMSIAATNADDVKASFSNYGLGVAVAAPGKSIYSTIPGGLYGTKSGTSMSSPVVAGLAALVKSAHPTWTSQEIIDQIIATADYINVSNPLLDGKLGGGRVNAEMAVGNEFIGNKLKIVSVLTQDTIGDYDDELEGGETVSIYATIKNFAHTAENVTASLSISDPWLRVSNDASSYGSIRRHHSVSNIQDPFIFYIDTNVPSDHEVDYQLRVFSDSNEVFSKELKLKLAPSWRNLQIPRLTLSSSQKKPVLCRLPDGSILILMNMDKQEYGTLGLFYCLRENNGTLTKPEKISSLKYSAYYSDFDLAPDYRAHVVYEQDTANYPVYDYQIFYINYLNGTWTSPLQITTDAKLQSHGDIGISADINGLIHVVWIDYRSGQPQVYYKYNDGVQWYAEELLWDLDPNLIKDPEIALLDTEDGMRHLFIYDNLYHRNTYFCSGTSAVWGQLHLLDPFYFESLPVLHDNSIFITCKGISTDYLWGIAEFNGSGWTYLETIGDPNSFEVTGHLYRGGLAFDSSGSMRLAYQTSSFDGQPFICWTVRNDNAWTYPQEINPGYYNVYDPSIATDDNSFDHVIVAHYGLYYEYGQKDKSTPPTLYFTNSPLGPNMVPVRPVVFEEGEVATAPNSLAASWSLSHPISITEYEYSIGTAPGQQDLKGWTSAGTATNVTADLSLTPLVPYQQYFVNVRASNEGYTSPIGSSDGIVYIPFAMDRPGYFCSDSIHFLLNDPYLIQSTQNIIVTADGGDVETVVLSETPAGSGLFRGSLTTYSDPVILEDGTLQVAHGDVINAIYEDVNDGTGHYFTATAVVDCTVPSISNISVIAGKKVAIISFDTNEPTYAIVRYGLSPDSLTEASDVDSISLNHFIVLDGLDPNTTYFCKIEVTDISGHITVEDNDGDCYQFTTLLLLFLDSNLQKVIEDELGISDPSIVDMLNLTYLNAYNRAIVDLTGLEFAVNMTDLYLHSNQISDISAVSDLAKLEYLYLSDNQISDINAVSNLTNLLGLSLSRNQISDINAVSGLTNLSTLALSSNQFGDINAVSGLTNLSTLALSSNQFGDINAVSGLAKLEYLYLSDNQISDINAVSNLTKLRSLDLSRNQISDINAVSGLTNLWKLHLYINQISDISAVSNLTNLYELWLFYNKIMDISALSEVNELVNLYLHYNQISDISALSSMQDLSRLELHGNQISDISALSELTSLKYVKLLYNTLNTAAYCKYIPLIEANNPELTYLGYSSNPNPMTNDCSTNFLDLGTFALHWLETDCKKFNNWCLWADLDHVDDVDYKDLAEFVKLWLADFE